MIKEKCLLIFNPFSGKGLIKNYLVDIVDIIVKSGYEVTIYPTQSSGDAVQKIINEGEKFDRIICSGGDGTLDEVITGLLEADLDIPVGYIPAGSTNDFANSLGISKNMVEAAHTAANGTLFPCDMGYFNGDTFVYVAAFGIFTEVSYKTPQQLKNIIGHLAYILEGVKHLSDIKSYKMKIEYDGKVIEDKFIYGMISNSVSVGGFKGMTGKDVKLDDGVFEATFIKTPKNPVELSEILTCLTNLRDDTDYIYSFKTDELKITCDEKVAWTTDGEFGGNYKELTVKNLHKAVSLVVDAAEIAEITAFPSEVFEDPFEKYSMEEMEKL